MTPLQFIVNADDLGWSTEVNDSVFALMESGRVTSATILANGAAFEDAARRARVFLRRCSFGVHLNLTTGKPVTHQTFGALLDPSGSFMRSNATRIPWPSLARALTTELEGQVRRVRDAGIPVSHLDSHHHIHCRPLLAPIVKSVQRRTGIARLRLSENIFRPPKNRDTVRLGLKRVFNSVLRHLPPTRTTDWFADFGEYLACVQSGTAPLEGRIELMTHPGATGPRYLREADILKTDWLAAIGHPARLITYHEI